MSAVRVDQVALRFAAGQRQEFLLAVNVDQSFTECAHLLKWLGLSVDVGTRAAVAADGPAQDHLAVLIEFLFTQPSACCSIPSEVENR